MNATHTSLSTTASKKQGESKTDSVDQVLDIMQRAEAMGQGKKQPFMPSMNPIIGKGSTIPKIASGKVKVTAQTTGQPSSSGGIVVGQGLGKGSAQGGIGAFESRKPVKATAGAKEKTQQESDPDKQSLSLLFQGRSEESKR